METRAKQGIFKLKNIYIAIKYSLLTPIEPYYVLQALKVLQWRQTLTIEFNAFMSNGM